MTGGVDWSVSIYGRNEAATIGDCLTSVLAAAGGRSLHVAVMLNGCTDRSAQIAAATARGAAEVDIYTIAHADKSNAWNQFVHRLRPPARTYFFVDAYAAVAPQSFSALARALAEAPGANAAAALPSSGRSAPALREAMLRNGGLHGSLFALSSRFLDRLTQTGWRLPVGLYRGDGLINSMAVHDLGATTPWQSARVVSSPEATWRTRPQRPFRPADAVRHLRRRVRQARGRMEVAAIQDIIYRAEPEGGFGALPNWADAMLLDWIAADPARRPTWRSNFFGMLAARNLRRTPPAEAMLVPILSPPVRLPARDQAGYAAPIAGTTSRA